jgi:hypothetical protein
LIHFYKRWEVNDGLKGGWSAARTKSKASRIGFIIPHEVSMRLEVETFTGCISGCLEKNP